MTGVKILGTGTYLPERVVQNDDFAAFVDTSDEWIQSRTGMSRRHIASTDEPVWHMGAKAAEEALRNANLSAADIDMILVTTVTADFSTPSIACLIQGAIGAENAFAMDLNVACTGLAFALDMARRYLATGDVGTVLLVCAEQLSQLTNYDDRSTCVLFGDGAAACVARAAEKPFAAFLKSDATGAQHIYSKKKLRSIPFFAGTEEHEPFPVESTGAIVMNGREVYKFATKAMPEAILNACAKLGVALSDLVRIIPHQANIRILQTAAKNLGLPWEKIHVNIADYGNTSSASIAIGLDECIRGGRINRGDLVCIVGFGAGLTYGACVFEY